MLATEILQPQQKQTAQDYQPFFKSLSIDNFNQWKIKTFKILFKHKF